MPNEKKVSIKVYWISKSIRVSIVIYADLGSLIKVIATYKNNPENS